MTRLVAISMLAATLAGCGDETCLCVNLKDYRSPPRLRPDTTSTDTFEVSDEYFLSGLPVLDTLDVEGVGADGGVWSFDGWTYDRARNSLTIEEEAPIAVETIIARYERTTEVY